ncbi:MAG: hypothetical protein QMC85_01860 [Methanocellales archaeon]|nr:hypothetical protein [Methanocellales archaeon]MDI6902501.1 hypothetical protein [Methanocellales archaeon]
MSLRDVLKKHGTPFSKELGIDLESRKSSEIFKWFLASILFGKPIGEMIVKKTYKTFEERSITDHEAILGAGWDFLVQTLDEGGYVRYDFSTADKLLNIMETLQRKYRGDLNELHDVASDSRDLEKRLMEFHGVGEVTTKIFLRELRGIWEKADPEPTKLEVLAGKNLRLMKKGDKGELRKSAGKLKIPVVNLEVALLRIGKDFCRKDRCEICDLAECCKGCVRR